MIARDVNGVDRASVPVYIEVGAIDEFPPQFLPSLGGSDGQSQVLFQVPYGSPAGFIVGQVS